MVEGIVRAGVLAAGCSRRVVCSLTRAQERAIVVIRAQVTLIQGHPPAWATRVGSVNTASFRGVGPGSDFSKFHSTKV